MSTDTLNKKPKTFHMTKDEQVNLAGRDGMAGQYEFLVKLIRQNMRDYVTDVIKKRLNIPAEQPVSYDIDSGIIQLMEVPKVEVNGKDKK